MEYITIREAMDILGITKQGVWFAIKTKRLPSTRFGFRPILLLKEDVETYKKSKHIRQETLMVNGEKVFNKEKGILSTKDVAELLKVSFSHVHYAIQKGYLKKSRIGHIYFILEEDALKYKNSERFRQVLANQAKYKKGARYIQDDYHTKNLAV